MIRRKIPAFLYKIDRICEIRGTKRANLSKTLTDKPKNRKNAHISALIRRLPTNFLFLLYK